MLYRFTAKEAGDVVMLAVHARQLLELMGRSPEPRGLLPCADMEAALSRLRDAVRADEVYREQIRQAEKQRARDEPEPLEDPVTLRQRAAPLLAMMQRCQAAGCDILWGV